MKTSSHKTIAATLTCLTMLAFAGCKGEKSGDVTARSGDPQSPEVAIHDPLSSYGFEKRDEFASQFTAMRAEFSAKVAELEAKSSQTTASETTRSAIAELNEARTQFEKRISALPTATADTWATARDDVNRAWDRMEAAYERAKQSLENASS